MKVRSELTASVLEPAAAGASDLFHFLLQMRFADIQALLVFESGNLLTERTVRYLIFAIAFLATEIFHVRRREK